jgi:glycosyltransferase involved in cell wall biosynthesis
MKKILIITYYWPPAGGPGVQRVLKFIKYMPEFGWQPIVLTVAKGEYPAIDRSLESEIPEHCLVYKTRHIEPNILYKSFTGMKTDTPIPVAVLTERRLNWRKRIAHFIRLNFFIPDAKILWMPFAMHTVSRIVRELRPDLILSSSPPPTVHLIARRIKKKYRLKWIADLRDPWTDIYSVQLTGKSRITRRFENRLERNVLMNADEIITVSPALEKKFTSKFGHQTRITVIPNGFDPDDFPGSERLPVSKKFTIVHAGKISATQNPARLFQTFGRMLQTVTGFSTDFELILVGNISPEIRESVREYGIEGFVTETGYVDHKKAIEYMQRAVILLLLIPDTPDNRGILTGKVFEYMASRRPILCIGPPDSDLKAIFEETSSGVICGYDDDPGPSIHKYFDLWRTNRLPQTPPGRIASFSRREQTAKLVSLFGL